MLVYGTLRRGQRANGMMEADGTYIETVRLPDALMFSLGGFPGIALSGGSGIECDLYRIDNPGLLRRADGYESFYGPDDPDNLYNRVVVTTPTGVEAFIYVYNGPPTQYVVETGDWTIR